MFRVEPIDVKIKAVIDAGEFAVEVILQRAGDDFDGVSVDFGVVTFKAGDAVFDFEKGVVEEFAKDARDLFVWLRARGREAKAGRCAKPVLLDDGPGVVHWCGSV